MHLHKLFRRLCEKQGSNKNNYRSLFYPLSPHSHEKYTLQENCHIATVTFNNCRKKSCYR